MRVAVLAVTIVTGVILGCSDVPNQATSGSAGSSMLDSAEQVAFGFRTMITDRGVLRAEIFADTALFLDQNTKASLRTVNADFFGAAGTKEGTMVARIGNFDTRTQFLEAFGDVVITSVDGRVLRSPHVRFMQHLNQISSDSAFVLTEPGEKEVRGIGFKADPNLTFVDVMRFESGRGGTFALPRN